MTLPRRLSPVLRFLALVAIHLVIAIPFKAMNLIPGFTDVRPVTAFGPVYAVFYGPLGCLATACGNLAADALDSALRWSSIAGFVANFLGPLLVWLYWTRLSRTPFALRTLPDLARHSLAVAAMALLETVIITPAVALVYPTVDASFFALTVFLNTAAFPILLGIPLAILLQEELGFVPLPPHKSLAAGVPPPAPTKN
jgi:energy-coupling factor transport system substrate-specific component